jgi:preprotein translocase subunit SecD
MRQYRTLIMILIIAVAAVIIDVNQRIDFLGIQRDINIRLGLDLVGGTQVLLEADLKEDAMGGSTAQENNALFDAAMDTATTIIENRVNGLGVSEAVVVRAGNNRIVVELPGVQDPEQARNAVKQTALLEFVDMSNISPAEAIQYQDSKIPIETDYGPTPVVTSTETLTTTTSPTATITAPSQVWHTIMTGRELKIASFAPDQLGNYEVAFELTETGKQIFGAFTSQHIGSVLAIVLDKVVISAPTIQSAITEGQGVITGKFTYEEAKALAVQLRYGALPIPLKEVEVRTVGPSLGEDSLQRSLRAGIIGATIVILFMALYYRLPGVLADVAIIIYALITLALYKYIPVTLTLPGIAGFLLSTGSALDANILIFERIKEELRDGRTLSQAIDQGWKRAWSSIRDSNFATLLTCAILYYFGSAYGATIVKGFSLTLLVGIFVSLFTAIFVTRTLLNMVVERFKPTNYEKWFGI